MRVCLGGVGGKESHAAQALELLECNAMPNNTKQFLRQETYNFGPWISP